MSDHPPAAMSVEAKDFLKEIDPAFTLSASDMSIADIRQKMRDACTPASEKAVARYGITCSDSEVEGVHCVRISPAMQRENRQILYVYGGGFIQGSPFEDLPIIAALAAKTGAVVICPTYRLAPEHPFPAALDDITAVAGAILTQNPDTLLVGESAGGNLALVLVQRLRKLGHAVPRALVALSPVTDLATMGDSQIADRDPFLHAARTEEVCAAYLAGTDPRNPEVSPIYGDFDSDFPPTLMTTGTRDLLLSGCVRLARVMREAGAPVDLRVWEGMWHVFEFYADIPEADASLDEISVFLHQHF